MKNKKNIVFGIHAVTEAVKSDKGFEKILIKKSKDSALQKELLFLLRKSRIPYQFVPIQKLNGITGKNHQGVIAYLSEIKYYRAEDIIPFIYDRGKIPFLMILDGVTDVRNFGAIARTAECAGVDAIIIPAKGSAQINADAIKTSAGALHKIPVCRSFNMESTIEFLKASGLKLVAATEKGTGFYDETDYTGPVAIISGAEDRGISKSILKQCDQKVKIPLAGEIDSLNVSVATAVFAYEVVRQRRK
ncbi:MAG: 23S rRNA (guanosine(2251)-2'-O)-methyltransferase RlmB [Bacteroidota bacterium]|nr:23S rRNA (guanosine(2251)-2'-O)-methyltransferase RlmB [Bacteroidota bacterium]